MKAQEYYMGLEAGDWLYDTETKKWFEVTAIDFDEDTIFKSFNIIEMSCYANRSKETIFINDEMPIRLRRTGFPTPKPGSTLISIIMEDGVPDLDRFYWNPNNHEHNERLRCGNVYKFLSEAEQALTRVKIALRIRNGALEF